MADSGVKTQRSLQELGIGDEAGVEALVGELRATLDAEIAGVTSLAGLEEFRVHWLGRKQGLLGAANDHWTSRCPVFAVRWAPVIPSVC
jgi:hypothetical protein